MGQLEDYLKGVALSPALERLRRGEDPEEPEAQPDPQQAVTGKRKRSINNDEREWLRRLTVEPGWQILMWLIDSTIEAREEAAIILSQTDPITNKDQMVKEWTYIASMKEVAKVIKGRVQREIEVLMKQKGVNEDGEILGE